MKIKTIKRLLSDKFAEFVASIQDEAVRKLVKKYSLISGGCITSMLLREDIHDFDIYFLNKETVRAVADYYAVKFGNDAKVIDVDALSEFERDYYGQRGFSEPGRVGIFCKNQSFDVAPDSEETVKEVAEKAEKRYEALYISPNAISLSNQVQIILRFYGTPEEIHSNYDYVHATNYWLSDDDSLHLNQPALESILTKELMYVGSKYPIASVLRTRKFIKRGWTINAGMYLKMSYQISELNLNDIGVLEDQLVGVDVAYFAVLIDAMRSAMEAHKDDPTPFKLTYPYICEILDRIF